MKRKLALPVLSVAALLSALVVFVSSAAGPNLVQNGDFSQGSTDWAPSQATTLVQPYFGALSVTNTHHTPVGFTFSAVQCVDGVSDVHAHTLAVDVLIPSGQPRSGLAQPFVKTFDGPGCSGSTTSTPGTAQVSSDVWTHREATFVPPDGTQSMLVVLFAAMVQAGPGEDPMADFTVAFDNVSLTQGYNVKAVTIEICKSVVDNGDAFLDSGVFTFAVAVQGQPPFVTDFPVQAGENDPGCATVHFVDYGVQVPAGSLLTVTENPLPGWTNQPGYPTLSANGGPVHAGLYHAGLANFGGSWIDYTNKRVANEGNVPKPEPRSITFCSQIDPNGDGDTESGTWIVSVFVQGNAVPVHASFVNPQEGGPADCLPLNLATLGVANETAFTITQTLSPFTQAAGYPKHDIGAGFVSGNIANFNYPLGAGDNFLVKFANKEAVAGPPPPPSATLEICKYVEDNGDGNVDGGTFTFQVGLGTIAQPPFLQGFPVAASETAPGCQTIDLGAYGVPPQGGKLLYVMENPLPGWINQAGYPTFSANNGPLHVGTYAGLANLGASRIDYTNKRLADEGGDPEPPTSPPTPPSTPTPPPFTPTPTSTPTPPSPSTPTVPSTPTPAPNNGGGNQGTPPATATPTTPVQQTRTEPGTEGDVAGVSTTPIPPSTGTGRTDGSRNLPLTFLVGLLAVAGSAPLARLALRRR